MCGAGKGQHGPNCWHLLARAEEEEDAAQDESTGKRVTENLGEHTEQGGEEETEEERVLRLELESKIEGNALAIQHNEELIQFLRAEVQGG